jgi:FkbM family methyltransferase
MLFIKIYAKIYEIIHYLFSINIPGLGFLYRRIKENRFLDVKNKKLFFNSKIADNYGMLVNNTFNEKETHSFLNHVFNNNNINNFHFVDIGGNIGEFVLDYSDHENINNITVFEPQPEQSFSIEQTIAANKFTKTNLIKRPVSSKVEEILFNFNETNSTASGITNDIQLGTKLTATTIDNEFSNINNSTFVFLIDTEGAELSIMRGGENLIKNTQPLIIFEYNHVTCKHFTIDDVRNTLGKNYTIYKLNKYGKLTSDLNNIWNLVALPNTQIFTYLNKLIIK